MTLLATGSSVSLTLRDAGTIVISTNGGLATVLITPVVGPQIPISIGPLPARRNIGPFQEGATVVISNQSAILDYDQPYGAIATLAPDGSGLIGPTGSVVLPFGVIEKRKLAADAYAASPKVIGVAWAATTAYLQNDIVRLTTGVHLQASVAGTSGASQPTGFIDGRPITDGTVTWYQVEFLKTASDLDAPTVTQASAATISGAGLTETILAGSAAPPTSIICNDGVPFSTQGGAYMSMVAAVNGLAAAGGNVTSDLVSGAVASQVPIALQRNAAWSYIGDVKSWVEFYVTDTKFAITHHNFGGIQFAYIDGVRVGAAAGTAPNGGGGSGLAPGGGGGNGVIFDFNGVMKRRRVSLCGVGNFRGVALTAQGSISAIPQSDDVALLVGDSYCNTSTPDMYNIHMGAYLKKYLGFGGLINAGVGGSGYIAQAGVTFNLPQMFANPDNLLIWNSLNPKHIIIHTGTNDNTAGFTAAQVAAAALTTWQTIRTQFPTAKISICNGHSGNGGPSAGLLAMGAALLAQFNAWADPNSRMIQTIGTTAAASFIQGTGNTGAALTAGNASVYINADGHPSAAGARYLARMISDEIVRQWKNNY